MINTILLLDNYDEDSAALHNSLLNAGFKGVTIVLDDDGFLPSDVMSIYEYYCLDIKKKEGSSRYFNQINVPDYWEIVSNNNSGSIKNKSKEKGRIVYVNPKNDRLVKAVNWLDDNDKIRLCEHYNSNGILYAKTIMGKDEKKVCKIYFDIFGKETIYENYITKNIVLYKDGFTKVFNNKTDFVAEIIEDLKFKNYRIFFNSLATTFFVSQRLANNRIGDVLFWQEEPRKDIPGNMQYIIDGKSKQISKIYIQNRESYEIYKKLGISENIMKPLGYIYNFKRKNNYKNEALVCTNTDIIENIEDLIVRYPFMKFHIVAITEMSSKLMNLGKYKNVALYPGAKSNTINKLFSICDYYFDLNKGIEILNSVKRAFLNNQLIIGYKSTVHNKRFVEPNHIFNNYDDMIDFLDKVIDNYDNINKCISEQKDYALSEDINSYIDVLNE